MRILLPTGGACSALLRSLHLSFSLAAPPSPFSSSSSNTRRFHFTSLLATWAPAAKMQDEDRYQREGPCCSSRADDRFLDYGRYTSRHRRTRAAEQPVVVILGPTGSGKSKLSIDLATQFSGEVVNTDKIQVYRGLDVTTNKIPVADRRGVPHHLLGEVDPAAEGELSPAAFREMAARAVAEIAARGRLPVLAGGSNSFIYSALADRYDPVWDPFSKAAENALSCHAREERESLRYRCCFLWVDVETAVLAEHLDRRVDEMLGEGMVEELGQYFDEEGSMPERRHPGLAKAIGVPEFRGYFHGDRRGTAAEHAAAVSAIKANTRRLAEEQMRKIRWLGEERLGWELLRVDATAAVEAKLAGGGGVAEAWERDVVGPSVEAVERFLRGGECGEELLLLEAAERGGDHYHNRQQCQRQRRRIDVQTPALKAIG